ncbi:MAG: DUF1722 domain-containing protein [Oceanospirillales bacterium]|uniref:Uncharacterized protein YbgA (DUF1722 family) n=1 Tax=Marinobacterium halophilum TaxID=267374 RepID=A0A2P8ETN9_9GAMM|nr:DUF523 and DUF1722 domain-containing protein [Marinobacterium halophilum]MBR9829328.1 DUF1722 domain-containing protein [Oceanospirillales bacterium]PSL12839.1 uncharacterized protein YbgA (DUF1722 family) [Marinobacterium halophilum]
MSDQPLLERRIPVGISACLTGQKVRYNGGHKQSRYCLNVLDDCFEFEPFCPEVAIGLGIPREPIRLMGPEGEHPRAVGTTDPDMDVTDDLMRVGEDFAERHRHLRGFILMKGSPSCGMERVKVYHSNGIPHHADQGVFVRALRQCNPNLPLEEEARLNDAVLRENFITRVFVYDDWKNNVETNLSYHTILQFHSRQKYLLMAHHYEGYRELGRYLADAHALPLEQIAEHYLGRFMYHMAHKATRKSHTNVLMHLLGYLKRDIDSDCKQEVLACIEQYRQEHVHLVVPLTLLKHYVKRFGSDYIRQQTYLNPHPYELGLRNYI